MMPRNLVFWFLLVICGYQIKANPVDAVRKSFHAAVLDTEQILTFHRFSASLPADVPIYRAYQAVSEALIAQTVWNPIEKLSQVLKYQTLIAEAIENAPDNLEIRFLRFCVEYSIPKWLPVSNHLIEDKDFIIDHSEDILGLAFDAHFVKYISHFIEETGLCSSEEIRIIQAKLAMK